MKKFLVFTFVAALLASCSSKPSFELELNILNNSSLKSKNLVIIQKINGAVVYSDTTKIKKDNFLLSVPYKGTALLNISIPESNIKEIMMVAEEGKVQLNIEGAQTHFGGTPLNDRLQAFYLGNDSVSRLFRQIEQEYDLLSKNNPTTPQMKEEFQKKTDEFRQRRSQLLDENTNRIVAFIKENVDNPVGEFYFMTNYIAFPMDLKMELNSFATEKLKREFNIR